MHLRGKPCKDISSAMEAQIGIYFLFYDKTYLNLLCFAMTSQNIVVFVIYLLHLPACQNKRKDSSAGTLQLSNRRLIGCLKLATRAERLTRYSDLFEKSKSKSF